MIVSFIQSEMLINMLNRGSAMKNGELQRFKPSYYQHGSSSYYN
jgi:hypothetical protein